MDALLTYDLTDTERAEFSEMEARIERGLKVYYEVGEALLRIHEKRLYRADYDTFADYCLTKWHMGRSYAYRMMRAFEVADNLLTNGQQIPATERQARILTMLEPEQQIMVAKVIDLTAKELEVEPTTSLLKSVVEVISTGLLTDTLDGETTLTEAAKNAVVDEFYERRQRQKKHIAGDNVKPVIAEGWFNGDSFDFEDVPTLEAGVKYRVLIYKA